jgi:hypothetical protein
MQGFGESTFSQNSVDDTISSFLKTWGQIEVTEVEVETMKRTIELLRRRCESDYRPYLDAPRVQSLEQKVDTTQSLYVANYNSGDYFLPMHNGQREGAAIPRLGNYVSPHHVVRKDQNMENEVENGSIRSYRVGYEEGTGQQEETFQEEGTFEEVANEQEEGAFQEESKEQEDGNEEEESNEQEDGNEEEGTRRVALLHLLGQLYILQERKVATCALKKKNKSVTMFNKLHKLQGKNETDYKKTSIEEFTVDDLGRVGSDKFQSILKYVTDAVARLKKSETTYSSETVYPWGEHVSVDKNVRQPMLF